jgi:hypothetical protein
MLEQIILLEQKVNLLEQKVNLLEQKNKILRKFILLREYIFAEIDSEIIFKRKKNFARAKAKLLEQNFCSSTLE